VTVLQPNADEFYNGGIVGLEADLKKIAGRKIERETQVEENGETKLAY
jgi:hypothetical protein